MLVERERGKVGEKEGEKVNTILCTVLCCEINFKQCIVKRNIIGPTDIKQAFFGCFLAHPFNSL